MALCSVEGCGNKTRTNGLCNLHNQRRRHTGTVEPGPKAKGTLAERFWRKVDRRSDTDCWPWLGKSKTKAGYGRIQEGGVGSATLSAHRVSYTLAHGAIPERMVVMHTCDNPSCVNPHHLELGTYQANMDDMWRKGRGRPVGLCGRDNPRSKLTEDMVRLIRASPERGHKDLADEFGLSPNAVRGVRIGRTWRHIA